LQWEATMPTFEVGTKHPLKLKTPNTVGKKAWNLDLDNDAADLIDEDELLTEEDLATRPGLP
jgi:hypothetical protein